MIPTNVINSLEFKRVAASQQLVWATEALESLGVSRGAHRDTEGAEAGDQLGAQASCPRACRGEQGPVTGIKGSLRRVPISSIWALNSLP